MEAKEEALREEVKSKQKNLEFFGLGDHSHVVDKNGDTVSLSTLQSNDVVGIYFSAYWSDQCYWFTSQLIELYNECKEQDKSFEVVFVSSDPDKTSIGECYEEMPWYALSFSEHDLKDAICNVFDVHGLGSLVLLTGDGEIITTEGLKAVRHGIEYFPWNKEEVARAKADKEERRRQARDMARKALEKAKEAEKQVTLKQEESKRIVIRRHIGNITDVTISVDHNIQFETFSTVAAPSAVVPGGKKVWYEVTFKEGSGISQVGWATSEFKTLDGYKGKGVGDCLNSYGFDGQRTCLWHSGQVHWGKEINPNGYRVLGVAADLENGRLLFGIDGDWGEPMGVAFDRIDKEIDIFPALTASDMKLSVNFGDSDFMYGPPDSSFEKLKDVLEIQDYYFLYFSYLVTKSVNFDQPRTQGLQRKPWLK